MLETGFKSVSASVALMRPGESGIVTSCHSHDHHILKKLMAMGIIPGISLKLEQSFPAFVIKVGNTRLAFDVEIAKAIYVRIQ
ncbi:FeoA family protein [Calothrix sp. NIES-3974]|uniref:FeoA family protein n=1 Tax=Calothrix sp. NIES-3974 TaxID=2005462 RepID=UPI000B621067|nr:FeoA family protein [Calothrix sp. NIES-3974]BAZ05666.1 FeoA family protein [Calothrix sp. NIES-3974]